MVFIVKQQFNATFEKKIIFSNMLFKNALIVVPNSEERKSNVISFFFPLFICTQTFMCASMIFFFCFIAIENYGIKKNRSWLQNSHVLKSRSSTFSEHGVLNFSIKLFLKIHFDRNKITSIKTQTTTPDSLCYKKKIRKAQTSHLQYCIECVMQYRSMNLE